LAEHYDPYQKQHSPLGYVKVVDGGTATYYLVIMEPIVLENGTEVLPKSRFLLFASALSPEWITVLGENFKLIEPNVYPNVQHLSESTPYVALKSPQGELQGYLAWRLDMPGRRIFSSILPYVLLLLGVLVSIAVLLGRLASRLQSNQLAQAVRLAAQGDALRSLALSKDAIPTSEAYADEAATLARATLQLQHLSVWELSENRQTLMRKALIEPSTRLSVFGQTIERNHAPWLFDVLDSKKGLVAPFVVPKDNPDYWVNCGGAGALLVMPTLVRDQAIGLVLAINASARQWRPDEINFLASIADMLALSIESQARKRAEFELAQRIYFDELTGLPNRAYLGQKIHELLAESVAASRYVCILVNVEGLVLINDKYGVATGDHLLVGVAKRLEHFCGATELVGRVGDNRFLLVLDLDRGVNLPQRMDMLFGFFSSPVKTTNISLLARLNIGASYIAGAQEWQRELHNAEIALHTLHRENRENAWVEYSVEHHVAEQEERALREDLQQALERNEFFLLYQPIINLASGKVCGAEALIRWQHPVRGLITPLSFIPLAEATGCIYHIGLWVLSEALRQNKVWQAHAKVPLTISVNVSMIQLEHGGFAEDVRRILAEEDVNGSMLELEVTESIALSSAPEVEQNLALLRSQKVKLAIDDFGTGYASFSYLRRFEVGKLKIDRMFLEGVPTKNRATNLVKMIITMGHTLNAEVTGEGIETASQAAFLRASGCEFGQGFYFGKPLSVADFSSQINVMYKVN
jgi:diguanylate cyclase (GGDEF)-like protein